MHCTARRSASAARTFPPLGGGKVTTFFRLAGKSLDFFDSLSRGGEIRPGFLSSAWKDGEQTMRHTLELTPRLRTAADLVPAGARLADIGTDHAYLPAALLLEGKIPYAIAADLRHGPLLRAKETAAEYGCRDKMGFRLCDGLKGIRPEETDAIVIAGMGGETIAQILAAAPWVRERNVPLVLQPMSSLPDLREWLFQNGYQIEEERLAREEDAIYVVMSVQTGEMAPLTPAELWAGRQSRDALRGPYLEGLIRKLDRAIAGLSLAREGRGEARKQELEQVRDGLQDMKKEWDGWQR